MLQIFRSISIRPIALFILTTAVLFFGYGIAFGEEAKAAVKQLEVMGDSTNPIVKLKDWGCRFYENGDGVITSGEAVYIKGETKDEDGLEYFAVHYRTDKKNSPLHLVLKRLVRRSICPESKGGRVIRVWTNDLPPPPKHGRFGRN